MTCVIRYGIDPFKVDAFEQYARNWGQVIPRCGVDLIGYFAPHEGSTKTAYGLYNIDSLAAYEQHRARLRDEPAPGRKQQYLDLAAASRKELEIVDGSLSVERFQSLANPERMLSLSYFRDEEAVRHWRNTAAHRATQARGRAGVFADYRLRVASILRDYGMEDRTEAPTDSLMAHHPIMEVMPTKS